MSFRDDIKNDIPAIFEDCKVTAKYTSQLDGNGEIDVLLSTGALALSAYDRDDDTNDSPTAWVITADFENARHMDTLEYDNIVYEVIKSVPDDYGFTFLKLNKTRDDN